MPRQGPNSVDAQIGRRLRELRRSRKLSQSEIGAIVGIEYQQVQKIERGINRIAASQMFATAEDLGVPLAYFFPEPRKAPKRTRPRSDPKAEAAEIFARTTKGVRLLRAVSALEDGRVRDTLIGFAEKLARRMSQT